MTHWYHRLTSWLLIFPNIFLLHFHVSELQLQLPVYKRSHYVSLAPGFHRRLYVHKQRSWPGLSQPPRQNGKLLSGWDAQIFLPAVLRRPRSYQFRQICVQHRSPSSARMARRRVIHERAHTQPNTHLSGPWVHKDSTLSFWYLLFYTRTLFVNEMIVIAMTSVCKCTCLVSDFAVCMFPLTEFLTIYSFKNNEPFQWPHQICRWQCCY